MTVLLNALFPVIIRGGKLQLLHLVNNQHFKKRNKSKHSLTFSTVRRFHFFHLIRNFQTGKKESVRKLFVQSRYFLSWIRFMKLAHLPSTLFKEATSSNPMRRPALTFSTWKRILDLFHVLSDGTACQHGVDKSCISCYCQFKSRILWLSCNLSSICFPQIQLLSLVTRGFLRCCCGDGTHRYIEERIPLELESRWSNHHKWVI